MPRLTADTRDEFIEYLRRKVAEGLSLEVRETDYMTGMANDITASEAKALTTDGLVWRTVNCLIEVAIENKIKIPVRVKGKIINIADRSVIETMTHDAGRRIGATMPYDRAALNGALGSKIVHALSSGIDPFTPGRKYKPTPLTVYLGYAISHGSPSETIIFPSGRASKGKT